MSLLTFGGGPVVTFVIGLFSVPVDGLLLLRRAGESEKRNYRFQYFFGNNHYLSKRNIFFLNYLHNPLED